MTTPILKLALAPVVQRQRRASRLRFLATCLVVASALWVGLLAFGVATKWALLALAGVWVIARFIERSAMDLEPDYQELARQVEAKHPELHALLLTAVEQRPDPRTKEFGYLQQRVIDEAVEASRGHDWGRAVPTTHLLGSSVLVTLALALFLLVVTSYHPKKSKLRAAAKPVAAATAPVQKEAVEVTPGDASVERGTGMVISARFGKKVPQGATLLMQPVNRPAQQVPLTRNLADPIFATGLPEVDGDFTYRIAYGDEQTRDFTVKVFEYPRMDRADATLRFPDYTGLAEKTVPDTRRVSAVEGSHVDLLFRLNKPVKAAKLVAKDGKELTLTVDPEKPVARLNNFPILASQSYAVQLEDAEGRANKAQAQFAIEALPNRKPELKLLTPRGDVRVSPLEEVSFRAEVWDDFGLRRYGLTYTVAGQPEKEVELGQATKADERKQGEFLLPLESLGLAPDELISYFVWAEDTGPDGKPRRTATDLFFAEVRPFEEIYRQGDGSESKSQQGGAGEAAKLAELQKMIVTATWNLQRAETGNADPAKPSAKYLKDEPTVSASQAEALKQAEELKAKTEDPKSQGILEDAQAEMQKALAQLKAAEKTTAPLPAALAAEQAAYNALLKLAAHEYRIVQNQSRSKSQGEQRMQAQLDELELKPEKKRYEQQSEAEEQEKAEQREQLAILNRLKELAQRQQDINERLKELQNSLQAAKTEEQKEEIERQLKRLREEEQQMLTDLDELKQKMEQSPQQSQLAEERRQVEQTRSEAQQAAQAMEQKEASQALASGTRAQRQLQQMRDDFRKKTSSQFNDEMRQMRNDARELADSQQAISEKLAAEPEKNRQRTLDGSGEREKLAEKLAEQRQKLEGLTDNMKRVSEQAEAAEPLLARELYDTLRKSSQTDTSKTLEMTKMLAERGSNEQARKFEEKARKEIEDLKTGVERAAESVLGDEAEALRLARAELDTLTRELNRELTQARPDLAESPQPSERAKAQGQQPGNSPSPESQTSTAQETQPSQQAGQQPGQQAGQQPGQKGGQQPGQQQRTAQSGSPQPGGQNAQGSGQRQTAEGNSSGENGGPDQRQLSERRSPSDSRGGGSQDRGGLRGGAADGEQAGPLTGDRFVEWSDRLRNVEEMLDDPKLRAEAAQVREVARGMRAEFKRHSVAPNWDMVQTQVSKPLGELRNRVTEELARRDSKENLVPIDRDPVPLQFAERVRQYYEELGRSR